jgi:hypothetical protein
MLKSPLLFVGHPTIRQKLSSDEKSQLTHTIYRHAPNLFSTVGQLRGIVPEYETKIPSAFSRQKNRAFTVIAAVRTSAMRQFGLAAIGARGDGGGG